jgi:hypothetical protein
MQAHTDGSNATFWFHLHSECKVFAEISILDPGTLKSVTHLQNS